MVEFQVDFLNDGEPFEAPKVPIKYQHDILEFQTEYGLEDEEMLSGSGDTEIFKEALEKIMDILCDILKKVDSDIDTDLIMENLTYQEMATLLNEVMEEGQKGKSTFKAEKDFLSNQEEENEVQEKD